MLRKFLIGGFVVSSLTFFIYIGLLIFSIFYPGLISTVKDNYENIYYLISIIPFCGMFIFILLLAGTSDPITQNVCVVEYVRVVENDKEN